jgi:hypothetical protein
MEEVGGREIDMKKMQILKALALVMSLVLSMIGVGFIYPQIIRTAFGSVGPALVRLGIDQVVLPTIIAAPIAVLAFLGLLIMLSVIIVVLMAPIIAVHITALENLFKRSPTTPTKA